MAQSANMGGSMGRRWMAQCCTLLLLLAASIRGVASPNPSSELTDRGRPFIRLYTYQDYGNLGFCYTLGQDSRGIIYAANESGVLEFDGENWMLYSHPKSLVLLTITVSDSHRVYAGFVGDCGYFDFNGSEPQYASHTQGVPDSVLKDVFPWRVYDTPMGVLYWSVRSIIYLDPDDSTSVMHPQIIMMTDDDSLSVSSAFLDGRFLFLRRNMGMCELREIGDSLRLLDATYTVPDVVGDMVAIDDSTVMVIVEDGIRLFTNHYYEFKSPEISDFCLEYKGKYLSKLNDSLFALSTEEKGIALFNRTGRIVDRYSKEDGLASNVIWDRVFMDADGALWVPAEGGISYIEWNSPFSFYDQQSGLDGERVLTMARFSGDSYFGTSNSLFRLKKGPGRGIVEFVHGDGFRYIALEVIQDRLLVGNGAGLWELRAGESNLRNIQHDRACDNIHINPDSTGFLARGGVWTRWYRMGKDSEWMLNGEIAGVVSYPWCFHFDGEWGCWCVYPASPHAQRIRAKKIPPESIDDFEVVGYDSAEGIPTDFDYGIGEMVDGHPVMMAGDHFLEYDREADRFHSVELVDPGEEGEGRYLHTLREDSDGGIWYKKRFNKAFRYAYPDGDSFRIIDPFARMVSEIGWTGFFERDPLLIWIRTNSRKLIRFEPSIDLLRSETRHALIRRFEANSELLYAGGVHFKNNYRLAHDAGNLQITYTLPYYAASDSKRYRYRLIGYEDEWSDWTEDAVKEYMNLDPGEYRFEVYGRDGYGRISEAAVLSFRILPPWYETAWAYGLYVLALLAIIYGAVRIRTARILLNNVRLKEKVDEKTAELTRTVQALNTEVGQRKAAEVESENHRGQLNAIFHGVNEGILTVNEDGVITRLNRTALTILGIEENSLTGKEFDDTAIPLPEAMVDGIRQCLETGKPIRDFQVTQHRDDENRILVANISSLASGSTGRNRVLLVFRDVTRLYQLEREIEERAPIGDMLGVSPAMIGVFNRIDELADTTATVLIQGETGTGKGMVAAALHQNSPRKNGPFVVVNCAALNENLLASELFGHVKGAFTGAISDREGRFQAAAGGTLFLDEIGDISPLMQASLLRVLEKGEYERVGETKVRVTDARIITATNRDLKARIKDGRFREDLFYRLNVVSIYIPPLRERKDDIPVYVEHFFDKYRESLNRNCDRIAPETMEMLLSSDWPGNVRALENAIRSAIISCSGDVLMPHHFPREVMEAGEANTFSSESPATHAETQRNASAPVGDGGFRENSLDRDRVLEALAGMSWNISRAARQLGISRQYLHRLINKHDLKRPE